MIRTCSISVLLLVIQISASPDETEERKTPGCGIRYDMGTRIVGGTSSHPGRWPWMAAMYRGSTHYCGGVLITDRHILTAAHCVARYNLHTITVRLGDFDLGSDEAIPDHLDHEITVGIRRAVIHKEYEAKSHKNDIAVLRITQSMNFSPYIQRVCLPPATARTAFEGKTAVVAGWGTVAFRGPSSPHLREVEVPIWGQPDCAKAMGEARIFDTTFCAGGKDRVADSCQGDSGGPLMLQMQDHRFAVVGVVSWGVKCGDITKPGVYTRVAHYTDWILSAVRLTYKDEEKHERVDLTL